ncbi:hypothetical protein LXA43DRAFT_1065354, partial [Ganoderma leucocontextum]
KLECHEHRAVLAATSQKAPLEATGIGAAACSRHGFFFPHCVVDFQKGEQQKNMDYCLCQVALYLTGLYILLALYDIWCFYYVHLFRRIKESPGLSLPTNLEIVGGIGQFHVHGHRRECYPRFSPNFIPGAGILLGERCTSSRSGEWLASKLDLPGMLWPSSPKQQIPVKSLPGLLWQIRLQKPDRTMCKQWIYMSPPSGTQNTGFAVPTRAQILLELLQKENSTRDGQKGCASWISSGLKIDEARLAVASKARSVKSGSPLSDKISLEQARSKVLKDIEKFHKTARQFLRSEAHVSALSLPHDVSALGMEWDALEDSEDRVDAAEEQDDDPTQEMLPVPEQMVIALPSNLGSQFCKMYKLQSLVTHERKLRIGQLNDALHAICVGVGYKSFLYRHSVRTATSQRAKLRSFDDVHLANDAVLSSARLYTMARSALIKLYDDNDGEDKQALTSILAKYQPLAKQDLKANTAIIEQAVRGTSHVHLPWFWTLDVEGDSEGSGWMKEMYRVVWLRAYARKTLWEEEITILPIEMESQQTLKVKAAERAQRAVTTELYLQAFKRTEILSAYPENATEGQRLRFSHGLGRELWTASNAMGLYGAAGFASGTRNISIPKLLQVLLQEVERRGLEIYIDIGKLDCKYLLQTYPPQWRFDDSALGEKQWWKFPQDLYEVLDPPSWMYCDTPCVDIAHASTVPMEIYSVAMAQGSEANYHMELEKQLRKNVVQAMGGNVFIPEAEGNGTAEGGSGQNSMQ